MHFWETILKAFGAGLEPDLPRLGANLDTRTPEERAEQDIPFEETVSMAAPVDWQEIPKEKVRTFPTQNQSSKSSCVAETRRKLKRIMLKVNKNLDLDFSSVWFYRRRSNFPGEGMIAADAIKLDKEVGMTLDVLVPSDVLKTESAANALKADAYNDDIAKVFRTASDDVVFTSGDLDTPASTIQKTRKGVMMWFYFTSAEWSREVPVIIDKTLKAHDKRALRHSVAGVEPALYKGKQGVWIEDSAHFGKISRRFITREFYEKRNFWASYPISFKFEAAVGERPHYFEGSLSSVQDCLKYEGVFPLNIESTGVLGPITRQAIRDFQAKYAISQTGELGPITRAKLKQLYP
jgi:hypothetical protein